MIAHVGHAWHLELAPVHIHAGQDVARGEEAALANHQGLWKRHLEAHGAAVAKSSTTESDERWHNGCISQHLGGLQHHGHLQCRNLRPDVQQGIGAGRSHLGQEPAKERGHCQLPDGVQHGRPKCDEWNPLKFVQQWLRKRIHVLRVHYVLACPLRLIHKIISTQQLEKDHAHQRHHGLWNEQAPVSRGERRRAATETPCLTCCGKPRQVDPANFLGRHATHSVFDNGATGDRAQRLHVSSSIDLASGLQGGVRPYVGTCPYLHTLQHHSPCPVVHGSEMARPVHSCKVSDTYQVKCHDPGRDHGRQGHISAQGLQCQVPHEEEGDATALVSVLAHKCAFCQVLHKPMAKIHQAVDVMLPLLIPADEQPFCQHQQAYAHELLEKQQGQ
mmetsp:Transcript_15258/g.28752  ORF Transcript_15258/g.28752 Transcript_15258/m.28752 type:complete len:388 (+) Transcript_15258:977-2140(+)